MSVFCPQKAEHGWGLRNPAGGAGSWAGAAAWLAGRWPARARLVVSTYWLMPTVPETAPASDDGIVIVPLASCTLWPFTW